MLLFFGSQKNISLTECNKTSKKDSWSSNACHYFKLKLVIVTVSLKNELYIYMEDK